MNIRNIEIIHTSVSNSDQSWYFEQIARYNVIYGLEESTHKLRVRIRREAYDAQSYAMVHRWDGNQWQEVIIQPISSCVCKKISYVDEKVTKQDFTEDYDRLVTTALNIVT